MFDVVPGIRAALSCSRCDQDKSDPRRAARRIGRRSLDDSGDVAARTVPRGDAARDNR
jgi:hypothetical protein